MLKLLEGVRDLPKAYLERLRAGAEASAFFGTSTPARTRLNSLLRKHGLSALGVSAIGLADLEGEEIPF